MSKLERVVIGIAVLGLAALAIALGTGIATGVTARTVSIVQGILLIVAAAVTGRRWYGESQTRPYSTTANASSGSEVTTLASTILDDELPRRERD